MLGSPQAPQHLQLGEGLLLADVDLDAVLTAADPFAAITAAAEDPARCLGATAEGCVFRCSPEIIHLEARGRRTPVDGTLLSGSVRATLSGTLLDITPENAARLLALPAPDAGTRRTLEAPAAQTLSSAMETLCWVGTLGGGWLAIELRAPVNTGGFTFRAGHRGTGTLPFTFLAQQRSPDDRLLPFRLHWLTEATA